MSLRLAQAVAALAVVTLLTGCSAEPKSAPAVTPVSAPAPAPAPAPATEPAPLGSTPTPAQGPTATAAQPAGCQQADGATPLKLAYTSYGEMRSHPLYGACAADRPALARIADMIKAAQYRPDAGVGPFAAARPHVQNLTVVYPDGKRPRISDAYRCANQSDINTCKVEPDWVLIDGQAAYAPALAHYFASGWNEDMKVVTPGTTLVITQPAHAQGAAPTLKPGDTISLKATAAVLDPVKIELVGAVDRNGAKTVTLDTVAAPTGDWTWTGKLPADLPPGQYVIFGGGDGASLEIVAK